MPIEATMVILDNSEYARNGDLDPSRWEAQLQALQLVVDSKMQMSMENGVGLILSGGKQVQLIMTPTNDGPIVLGQVLKVKLYGSMHFTVSLQQAQLALKHRVNKQQKQRIVCFLSSPIDEDDETITSIAKKMKKNNISVDLINFGEQNEEHLRKLELFHTNVEKGSSFLLNLKPGSFVQEELFTAIASQAYPDQPGQAGEGGAQPHQPINQFQEYGGIDPNIDPELAMALKMSLEENKPQEAQPAQPAQPQQPQQQQQQEPIQEEHLMDEEGDDEEALLAEAKKLSMLDEPEQQPQPQQQQQQQDNQLLEDHDFVKELLESVDVNMENQEIQKLLKKDEDKDKNK